MKRFLITTSVMLVISLLLAAAVFWYLSYTLPETSVRDGIESSASGYKADSEKTTNPIPEAGIPLNTLPLTDTQRRILSTINIDVNTYVITPAVYRCLAGKWGANRLDAVIDGAAPNKTELIKALPCLGGE